MPEAKEASLIETLDTTKQGLKENYLEPAGIDCKKQPYSADAMRLAVFRFLADTFKITDSAMRKQALRQFAATPGWFGANNSAGRQAMGYESDVKRLTGLMDVDEA